MEVNDPFGYLDYLWEANVGLEFENPTQLSLKKAVKTSGSLKQIHRIFPGYADMLFLVGMSIRLLHKLFLGSGVPDILYRQAR